VHCYICYNFTYNSTVGACPIYIFNTFIILEFYNFQASLNHRASDCSFHLYIARSKCIAKPRSSRSFVDLHQRLARKKTFLIDTRKTILLFNHFFHFNLFVAERVLMCVLHRSERDR
jgi:hypothetical protein